MTNLSIYRMCFENRIKIDITDVAHLLYSLAISQLAGWVCNLRVVAYLGYSDINVYRRS